MMTSLQEDASPGCHANNEAALIKKRKNELKLAWVMMVMVESKGGDSNGGGNDGYDGTGFSSFFF